MHKNTETASHCFKCDPSLSVQGVMEHDSFMFFCVTFDPCVGMLGIPLKAAEVTCFFNADLLKDCLETACKIC